MSFLNKKIFLMGAGIAVFSGLFLLSPDLAHAASAGGTAMPYDSALKTIQRSLTGTVAQIIVIVAIVGAFGAWILAGNDEVKEICKKLLMIAIAGGVIMFADKFVTTVFSGGAMIQAPQNSENPRSDLTQAQKAQVVTNLLLSSSL